MAGVTVAPKTASVKVGATVALTATVTPSNADNKAVTWSSDKTSIATVDSNGVVKGVAAGTAVITARTVDGNIVATATITVTAT